MEKKPNFTNSTKSISPTGKSGETSNPPIGDSFMYTERNQNKIGKVVVVSFQRTDIISISNISLYYKGFSAGNSKSMGRFRTEPLLYDNTRNTRFDTPKNDIYSISSTQGTLVSFYFNTEIYGINLIHNGIDTPHPVMCFSKIMMIHSIL